MTETIQIRLNIEAGTQWVLWCVDCKKPLYQIPEIRIEGLRHRLLINRAINHNNVTANPHRLRLDYIGTEANRVLATGRSLSYGMEDYCSPEIIVF